MKELDKKLLSGNVAKVVNRYSRQDQIRAMKNAADIMAMNQNTILFWKQLKSFIGVTNNNAIRIRESQQLQIQQGVEIDPEKIITLETIIYFKEMIKFLEKQEKALTELVINIAKQQVKESTKCTV